MRFGAWYAPAVQLGKNIYFCAMPLGSVIGGTFAEEDDVKLGGNVEMLLLLQVWLLNGSAMS